MNTPIIDFVKNYALSKSVRLHMPGHKGVSFLGGEIWDITEVDGADVLYSAKGVILESEMNATTLFGSAKTLYSTEGSSLSIRAMVHLVKTYALSKNRSAKVVAYRNAHKTFVSASALAGVEVKWLYSTTNDILSCKIDLSTLESAIIDENPVAVYVTSPDYLGHVIDVKGLAEICHRHGTLLLVDNAHGAYLKFVKDGAHPVDLGADLVCDSAHKTLPCLTGSAYLHVGKTAPDFFKDNAENALSLYASTSPSYLILQSLDNFNKVIADTPSYFDNTARLVEELKAKLASLNYDVVGNEPLKITLSTKGYGYLGGEVASHLQEAGIVVEFADTDYVTMMFSPCNTPLDFERTESALTALAPKKSILTSPPHAPVLKQGLPAKDAIFAPSETVAVKDSLGRILSSPTVSCPPAIPVAVCGEVIDEDAVKCFEYYNVNTILVVKE
jgi:arginine/lysine/ornithine decarboxylase